MQQSSSVMQWCTCNNLNFSVLDELRNTLCIVKADLADQKALKKFLEHLDPENDGGWGNPKPKIQPWKT